MLSNGQWFGRLEGDVPGLVVYELDERNRHLRGIAYHFPDDSAVPSVAATIPMIPMAVDEHDLPVVGLRAFNPEVGSWMAPEHVSVVYPGYEVPRHARLKLRFDGDLLTVDYETENTKGQGRLWRYETHLPSIIQPIAEITTWRAFREWALDQLSPSVVYRGQCVTKRLRTSFHRTKRKDLATYGDRDINELRRYLTPRLKHLFNPSDPMQTGALYNLAQHHGYPTPLLDWTESPFVAAYFAFRAGVGDRAMTDKVRIFAFDRDAWHFHFPERAFTAFARPHVSMIDLLPIENQRALPQQATAMITNIDDIEEWVLGAQKDTKQLYLQAIDLPLSEREQALAELNVMGINAGSLFPGLDGACEALAFRNFDL